MSDDAVRERLRLYAGEVTPAQLPSFGGVAVRRRQTTVRRAIAATASVVVVVLVVVLVAVVRPGGWTAAPSSGTAGSAQLQGRWSLTAIDTAGTPWQAPAGATFSLTFTQDSYAGNDGCNDAGGTVSYGRGTVRLSLGEITEVGCTGADQARMEQAFRLLIGKDLPVSVSAGTLTVTAGQTVFALSRVQPVALVDLGNALPGTTWALVSIGTTGAQVSSSTVVPADVHADIAFRTKDFSASDGCNSHSGEISYGTTVVTFDATDSDLAFCDGPAGANGSAYAAVLQGRVTATIVGNSLTLSNAQGSLTFSRETSGPASATPPPVAPVVLEDDLVGQTWTLESLTAPGVTWHPLATSGAVITFTDTHFEASDGCDSTGSDVAYDPSGSSLTFGGGNEDSGECLYVAPGPPDSTTPPAAFLALFTGKVQASLSGTSLTLTRSGTVLVFSDAPPAPLQAELENVDWRLTSVTQQGVVTAIPAAQRARLFLATGSYVMDDGCDLTYGPITYESTGVTMPGGAVIGSDCILTASQRLVQNAFGVVSRGKPVFTVTGDVLTFGNGSTVLTFARHPVKSWSSATEAQ